MYYRLFMILFFVISCGQKGTGEGKSLTFYKSPSFEGNYEIVFEPLNEDISGDFDAWGSLNVKNNIINVEIDVKKSPHDSLHHQNLYTVERCPDLRDDLNRDGIIDEQEVTKKVGLILVPIDGDLSEQMKGYDSHPQSNSVGAYKYQNSGSFFELLDDLLKIDTDEHDGFKKLINLFSLNLKKSVIIVFGVNPGTYLPDTINTNGHLPFHESFPIACGQLISRFD